MSTLTITVPVKHLQWWRLRLPYDTESNSLMLVQMDSEDPDNVTKVTYTIHDGHEVEMSGVVGCAMTQTYGVNYLWLLTDHQPTPHPNWEAVGPPVNLTGPFDMTVGMHQGDIYP